MYCVLGEEFFFFFFLMSGLTLAWFGVNMDRSCIESGEIFLNFWGVLDLKVLWIRMP